MHRGRTWSWVSLTWLLYGLQLDDATDTDFENSLYASGQSDETLSELNV